MRPRIDAHFQMYVRHSSRLGAGLPDSVVRQDNAISAAAPAQHEEDIAVSGCENRSPF
jgi:hypothetical protein